MNRYRGTQAEFQFSIVAPHTAHSKLLISRLCGHKPRRTYRIDDQILTFPKYAPRTVSFPVNNRCHNFPLRTPPQLAASFIPWASNVQPSGSEILRRLQNASILEQGCAGHSPNSANRKHQITHHPWRTSPPLRPSLSFRYIQPNKGKSALRPNRIFHQFGGSASETSCASLASA
jgi:hypothetical protein